MRTRQNKSETAMRQFLYRHLSTNSQSDTPDSPGPYAILGNKNYESLKPEDSDTGIYNVLPSRSASLKNVLATSEWGLEGGTVNEAYDGKLPDLPDRNYSSTAVGRDGYLEPKSGPLGLYKPKAFRQRGPSGGSPKQQWRKIGSGRYVTPVEDTDKESSVSTSSLASGPSTVMTYPSSATTSPAQGTRHSYLDVVDPDDASTRSNSPVPPSRGRKQTTDSTAKDEGGASRVHSYLEVIGSDFDPKQNTNL